MAAKLIATEVPLSKLPKKYKIIFISTKTPMPKKDGPLRKTLYGYARTIVTFDINEIEVEDLKIIVAFG
ncbi:hypothetical protein CONLIGDRAFT_627753 [Coniochaeta ligniaria NRRL 30616]|uniref:Uncharacterized protein n=1 Tax=Coniochaeta ligniaria NRRL 30616 TaxID=1408157 RepID=A0A1J7K1V6_9PEZI|nr:hypothetical protein CONLIGDRAFT_627753 [Coniochaeta ligniaria NRRL 30616]